MAHAITQPAPPTGPSTSTSIISATPATKRERASTAASSPSPPAVQHRAKLVKRPSHFLLLPREIRDLIYGFVYPGALVALGPFRVWVPEGKASMIGSCIELSGCLSRYLRCWDLPVHWLSGRWYTMMSGPVGVGDWRDEGKREQKRWEHGGGGAGTAWEETVRGTGTGREEAVRETGKGRERDVDLAQSMSETLVRIRKRTSGTMLPLIHWSSRSKRKEDTTTTNISKSKRASNCHTSPDRHRKSREPWSSNTALLFVCHQTSAEFAETVYSRSVFAFGSQREAICFTTLSRCHNTSSTYLIPPNTDPLRAISTLAKRLPVSHANLAHIRYICLDTRAEGLSPASVAPYLQERYYTSWTSACRSIATTLTSLSDISLFIDIPFRHSDWRPGRSDHPRAAFDFSLEAVWARPWLELARSSSLLRAAVYLCAQQGPRSISWGWGRGEGEEMDLDKRALECFAEVLRRCVLGWGREEAVRTVLGRYREDYPEGEETWRVLEEWNRVTEEQEEAGHAGDRGS